MTLESTPGPATGAPGEATLKRRGPYAKTARTRERIIDACEELYSTNGFRATTVKEIAERAGITDRGLVHHFPHREDLLMAVLERHESRSSQAIERQDPLESLEAVLAQEKALENSPRIVELRMVLSAEATDPRHPAHDHYARNYAQWRDHLATIFCQLRALGRLEAGADDDELATAFVALSDGLHLQRVYGSTSLPPSEGLRRFLQNCVPELR